MRLWIAAVLFTTACASDELAPFASPPPRDCHWLSEFLASPGKSGSWWLAGVPVDVALLSPGCKASRDAALGATRLVVSKPRGPGRTPSVALYEIPPGNE